MPLEPLITTGIRFTALYPTYSYSRMNGGASRTRTCNPFEAPVFEAGRLPIITLLHMKCRSSALCRQNSGKCVSLPDRGAILLAEQAGLEPAARVSPSARFPNEAATNCQHCSEYCDSPPPAHRRPQYRASASVPSSTLGQRTHPSGPKHRRRDASQRHEAVENHNNGGSGRI